MNFLLINGNNKLVYVYLLKLLRFIIRCKNEYYIELKAFLSIIVSLFDRKLILFFKERCCKR